MVGWDGGGGGGGRTVEIARQTRSPKMPQSAPGGTLLVEPQGESTGIAGTQR